MMEWFGKVKNCAGSSSAVVSIRKSQRGNQYNIYFRNEVKKLLIMNKYIQFAVDGNKVYFRGTNKENGVKLIDRSSTFFTKLTDGRNRLDKFTGDYYSYGYNKDEEALYIELNVIDGREKRK